MAQGLSQILDLLACPQQSQQLHVLLLRAPRKRHLLSPKLSTTLLIFTKQTQFPARSVPSGQVDTWFIYEVEDLWILGAASSGNPSLEAITCSIRDTS
jgi:hypothetical protein